MVLWSNSLENFHGRGGVRGASQALLNTKITASIEPYVGFMHSDLIGRMPYFPANYSNNTLIARARIGGADFEYKGQNVGEFSYWNWDWNPTHHRDFGTHGGVSVSIFANCNSLLHDVPEMQLAQVWRSTVLTRDSDYGEWREETN